MTDKSGQYMCPPAVPESGSGLARDGSLADRVVRLRRQVIMEKMKSKSTDQNCPFEEWVLYQIP